MGKINKVEEAVFTKADRYFGVGNECGQSVFNQMWETCGG